MSDRTEQARAEAEQQIHVYGDDFKARTLRANLNDAFVQGAVWADANPQPHTITWGALDSLQEDADYWTVRGMPVDLEEVLKSVGVQVTDDAD